MDELQRIPGTARQGNDLGIGNEADQVVAGAGRVDDAGPSPAHHDFGLLSGKSLQCVFDSGLVGRNSETCAAA